MNPTERTWTSPNLTRLMSIGVDVVTPGTKTAAAGDSIDDWANPTRETIPGWISQQSTTETVDGRHTRISTWGLLLPPDSTLPANARIEWNGLTFTIDGRPKAALTARGVHHLVANLTLMEG